MFKLAYQKFLSKILNEHHIFCEIFKTLNDLNINWYLAFIVGFFNILNQVILPHKLKNYTNYNQIFYLWYYKLQIDCLNYWNKNFPLII